MLHLSYPPYTPVQHDIQIKNGIMINVKASVKSIVRTKKILVGLLAHVFMRTADI